MISRKVFIGVGVALLSGSPFASEQSNPLDIDTEFVEGGEFIMGYCHQTRGQIVKRKRDEFVGKEIDDPICVKESSYSENAIPARKVVINGFWVSKKPILLSQYKQYLVESGEIDSLHTFTIDANENRSDDDPVVAVTPRGAERMAGWLSEETGSQWSLISEAQWEYLCTEGSSGRSECEDRPGGVAIGSEFREFTLDCWHDSYEGAPSSGVAWKSDCEVNRPGGKNFLNVVRGGDLGARDRDNVESATMYRNTMFRLIKEQ